MLLLLLATAAVLGGAAQPHGHAQQPPVAASASQFGGFDLLARSTALQAGYNIEGLVPGGAPILLLGLPEAVAKLSNGPTGYALASLAYPGDVLSNLGNIVEQGGGPPGAVPPYPLQQTAQFPGEPNRSEQVTPDGTTMQAVAEEGVSTAFARYSGADAPPVVTAASMVSSTQTVIEEGQVVSRARSELGGVSILGGIITIESVVTDLVAVHDGAAGATGGGTTVSGVEFLGLAASLDERGLVLTEAPPPSDGPAGPLGTALAPAADGLAPLSEPVAAALAEVFDQAVPQVNDLLAEAGVTIELVQPHESVGQGVAATRSASGVNLSFTYEGREQEQLQELFFSIPPELRPSFGPLTNPVGLLVENHITGLTLAPGAVSALASPPFEIGPIPGVAPVSPSGPGGQLNLPSLGTPAFSTPAPAIAPSGGGAAPGATEPIAAVLSGAIPALLVLLTLLSAPFFGAGSSRLADNVLAATATACPEGLDRPPGTTPRNPT